jgi:hypothetical protein
MIRTGLFLWALAMTTACGANTILTPPTGPGTEYPCGVDGTVCTVQKTCCPANNTCGGEPDAVGCPPGECCFEEGGPFGARRNTKQTPQRQ